MDHRFIEARSIKGKNNRSERKTIWGRYDPEEARENPPFERRRTAIAGQRGSGKKMNSQQ